jgi:hypothetical protein
LIIGLFWGDGMHAGAVGFGDGEQSLKRIKGPDRSAEKVGWEDSVACY